MNEINLSGDFIINCFNKFLDWSLLIVICAACITEFIAIAGVLIEWVIKIEKRMNRVKLITININSITCLVIGEVIDVEN